MNTMLNTDVLSVDRAMHQHIYNCSIAYSLDKPKEIKPFHLSEHWMDNVYPVSMESTHVKHCYILDVS